MQLTLLKYSPVSRGFFIALLRLSGYNFRRRLFMTADKEKMKLELFKTILANPSNSIGALDANKAVEVVEKMMQAITNPSFGRGVKPTA